MRGSDAWMGEPHLHKCHMLDNSIHVLATDFHAEFIGNTVLPLPLDNALVLTTFCSTVL
jgi:hypothetical protein